MEQRAGGRQSGLSRATDLEHCRQPLAANRERPARTHQLAWQGEFKLTARIEICPYPGMEHHRDRMSHHLRTVINPPEF